MRKKLIISFLVALVIIPLVAAAFFGPAADRKRGGDLLSGDVIGVINVEGVIMGGRSGAGVFGGVTAGADDLMSQLKEAREDERIKVVVMRVNSPGGVAAAAQEVGNEIDKLRKSGKKVIVSMGDMAASGGYWLAAKADKIVANPATMTGSIGVIMEFQNLQKLYGKLGVDTETFKSGPHKDIGSSSRQLSDEERKILQGMVDDIYNQFIDVVAKGRSMDHDKVRKLADGRIYTGRQAKELGLVDYLGNYYDALDIAKELANIKGEPEIYEFGPSNPWDILLGQVKSISPFDSYGLGLAKEKLLLDVLQEKTFFEQR
ncbi:MAG: signal peptide peptidase SppA [Thermincolia bacterium]